jgi:hypothetical protein
MRKHIQWIGIVIAIISIVYLLQARKESVISTCDDFLFQISLEGVICSTYTDSRGVHWFDFKTDGVNMYTTIDRYFFENIAVSDSVNKLANDSTIFVFHDGKIVYSKNIISDELKIMATNQSIHLICDSSYLLLKSH